MRTNMHYWSYLALFFLEWEIFRTQIIEKIKTHFMLNNFSLFFRKKRAVHEIMWKNILEPDRPKMTVWRMSIACRVPKATHTHTLTRTLTAVPQQKWLHERPHCCFRRTAGPFFACVVYCCSSRPVFAVHVFASSFFYAEKTPYITTISFIFIFLKLLSACCWKVTTWLQSLPVPSSSCVTRSSCFHLLWCIPASCRRLFFCW